MNAAQSGALSRARQLAEGALSKGGDDVALHAFLGMLLARSNDMAGAIRHLKQAHYGRPDDVTIACNLIAALMEFGDTAGAFDIATSAFAFSDPTLRVARYRGFLAQSLELFPEAIEAYEYVIERAAQDFDSWNNLGNARSAAGDFTGSVSALQRAVELDPKAAPSRINLATALCAASRFEEAENVLRKAANDFPSDARPLDELYALYKRDARHDEGMAVIEEAITRDPGDADLQLKFGIECGLATRIDDAEAAYRNAIALDPLLVDAYLGLAIQYEHTNREADFAPLIALGEANGLDQGALAFLRALEHRRAGRFEEGLASLSLVPPEIEPERSAHIRATLLDRLGRTEEAFEAFCETARLHEADPSQPVVHAALLRDELRAEIRTLEPKWVGSWSPDMPAPDRPDPVFLVGFPRSGTTLLDTILMGHPDTVVLEEKPPLNHVDQALGGLAGIPLLDANGIIDARRGYFDEVNTLDALAPTSLLIDKSPLFLSKVPLIHRLFPAARFIFVLRHPCDVLLSCFMSNFRLNSAMSNFLRLDDAADFYDLTFRHWERSHSLFPLNIHTIVYEKLVENVEQEVRPLFDFLGLEWHEDALDHRRTAKARGLVTTASYSQITEPIYKRATGRWERYREQLAPILPTLQPWVEKFGYTL